MSSAIHFGCTEHKLGDLAGSTVDDGLNESGSDEEQGAAEMVDDISESPDESSDDDEPLRTLNGGGSGHGGAPVRGDTRGRGLGRGRGRGGSRSSVVNRTLNSLETGLLTVDSRLPF
jgi:hypothetical protein